MSATFWLVPPNSPPRRTPTPRARPGRAARARHRARPGIERLEDRLVLNSYSPPAAGLVAWWSGDGNANDAVGGHNGTLVNGTYGPGFLDTDQAFRLDGVSSSVQVPDDPAWNLGAGDFSIDVWVNYSALRGDSLGLPQSVFIGHDEGGGNTNKWFFAYGGGDLYFHMNSPAIGPNFLALAPFAPNLNQWYNLAVTRSAGTFTVYVNGTAVASQNSPLPVPDASAPLTIGEAESPPGNFFMNGGLDDVVLYNRALSPQELAVLADPRTVTAVAASANPSVVGQAVTFTATVTADAPAAGTPTGGVQFVIDGANFGGPVDLVGGTASVRDAALAAGPHTVSAAYSGNGSGFAGSTGDLAGGQAVDPGATSTAVTSSANPSDFGQAVTFTATVTNASANSTSAPTGSVDFVDTTTGTDLGTAALGNGTASVSTATLPVGSHTITATYTGDPGFAGSSDSLGQTVNPGGTTTALTASDGAPLSDQAVTLTATVTAGTPAAGTPTGSIDFVDTTAGTDLGTAPLVNGVASLTVGYLAAGGHALTAVYGGDGNFLASSGTTALTAVAPASLSGTVFADFNDDGEIDFGENGIAGVPITLTGTDDRGGAVSLSQNTDGDGAFVFPDLRPGSYSLTEASQPSGYTQGTDSVGTAGGSLAAADQFFVRLAEGVDGFNYNYGERPAAGGLVQKGQTAGIAFWTNRKGQALILALNGGTGTGLADWLAATLPNTFGANAGGNDLAGKDNAAVAALFRRNLWEWGALLDAEVLATALSVYVTNATLDSTGVAAPYGFTVSGDGVGTATFNVGCCGSAFGVANRTTMTVLDLLRAADAQAVGGLLYNGNFWKGLEAIVVFTALDQAGSIH